MTAWIIAKAIPWLLGLMGLFGLYQRGKHAGAVKATREVMESYRKTAKAIDHADIGLGATDLQRIDRLREFAAKHGK